MCACVANSSLYNNNNLPILLFLLVACPIDGQFYTSDCFGMNATCDDPNPPAICDLPQCVCPQGQVIDTDARACINGSECSKYR